MKRLAALVAGAFLLPTSVAAQLDPGARGLATVNRTKAVVTSADTRLLNAASSAVDPFALPPLTQPPAWTVATAFARGQAVLANGNWSIATGSGTSAAAATSTFTGSISGGTLTVTSVTSGTIAAGQKLTCGGCGANTYINGGGGTSWTINVSLSVASTTITGTATGPAETDGRTTFNRDGSISWNYFGPPEASAPDANAPVVTMLTTPDTSALNSNTYRPFLVGGGASTLGQAAFRFLGGGPLMQGAGGNNAYAYVRGFQDSPTPTYSPHHWGVEFLTDSVVTQIGFVGSFPTVALWIDNRRYTLDGLVPNASGETWAKIANAGKKLRRYHLEFYSSNYGAPGQFFIGATVHQSAQVSAPPAGLTLACLSDSYYQSGGMYLVGSSLCTQVGKALGFTNTLNFSTVGTGHVNNATNYNTFGARIPDALTYNPDLWIFAGSVNDCTFTATQVTNAVTSEVQAIRAGGSAAPIVYVGVQSNNRAGCTLGPAANEAAVQAGIAASSDTRTFFVPFFGAVPMPWLTDSSNNSANTQSVNATTLVSDDLVHVTDAGVRYLAGRTVDGIRTQVYPKLGATQ